jgi:superfamily II DNA or RNA helicase
MKIIVTSTISRLVDAHELTPEIIREIDCECSFYYKGAEYTNIPMWDGLVHMFRTKTLTFGTGLLDRISTILDKYNIPVTIVKQYPPVTEVETGRLTISLSDYQREALDKIANHDRGVIKLPTGSGKGCIIAATVVQKRVPTIVLVHRKDLLYQTRNRFEREIGISPSIIGDGHSEFGNVTVAMVQTLLSNLGIRATGYEKDETEIKNVEEQLLKYNMVISDEAHCLGTRLSYKLLKHFKSAVYRYGFSATPFHRDEALMIEAAIGPILYEKKPTDLAGQYISHAKIIFVEFKHKGKIPKLVRYGDLYKQAVVNNMERNLLIKRLAERFADKRVLIAVRHIDHGKILNSMIKGSHFVHGSLPTEERTKILESFRNGNIKCVISTVVWEQGIDIPEAEVLIDARAERSVLGFIQLVGRVLRKTDTKNTALVIDIADRQCRWLSTHTEERIAATISEFGKGFVAKHVI